MHGPRRRADGTPRHGRSDRPVEGRVRRLPPIGIQGQPGVAPGDQVFFFVEADPLQPNQDQQFEYSAIVTPSAFNLDSNLSNNSLLVEIRSGLIADGFE